MTSKNTLENEKLDNIKKEYENIEVPGQLKDLVGQSIRRAKKENRRHDRMKKMTKRCAAGVAAAAALSVVLLNVNPSITYALEDIPVIGSIAKALTFQDYSQKEGNMELNMTVPSVEGLNNEEVQNQLNKSMEEYTKMLTDQFNQDVANQNGQDGHESVDTTFNVLTDNDKVFSARFETVIAMGSSDSFAKYYNVDKEKGKVLSLKDIFSDKSDYITAISENIIAQMKQQQTESEDKIYWIGENAASVEDEFKAIHADQNFYISSEGKLVIAFDKYEVAPGYMGVCEFTVDFDAIAEFVNKELVTN